MALTADPIPSAPPSLAGWTPGEADFLNKIKSTPSGEARSSDASARVCCTNVVHNGTIESAATNCKAREFRPPECCTSVVHKPRKRSLPPSSRSGANFRRQSSGLTLRGRVFYLRLRVPRSLVTTVGRTHLWRSLGTGNKAEAIRQARRDESASKGGLAAFENTA